jgi:hypothetical protein
MLRYFDELEDLISPTLNEIYDMTFVEVLAETGVWRYIIGDIVGVA